MDTKLQKEKVIAERFGIALSTLRADRIRERRIPFIKLGKSVFYDPIQVEQSLLFMQIGGVHK